VAELRGEKLLPEHHLNSLVVEIAEVMAKHGYPLQFNEDYNALRSAIAENYFKEWQGYSIETLGHTKWSTLRDAHHNPTAASKTISWLRSKLTRGNSSI